MKTFNTEKDKLNKIYQRLRQSESNLKGVKRKFINLNLEKFLKTPVFDLYLSDWNNVQIAQSNDSAQFRPASQGTNAVDVSHRVIIEPFTSPSLTIPEEWLPFAHFSFEVNSIPLTTIYGIHNYNRLSFVQRQLVTVAGDEIYRGIGRSNRFLYSQSNIDSGEVKLENLKRAWFVQNAAMTDSGRIIKVVIRYDTQAAASPCSGNNDFKELVLDYNTFQMHELTAINNTSITGYAIRQAHTWVDNQDPSPPDIPLCQEQITTISEGITTQSLVAINVDSVTFTIERTNGSTFTTSTLATVNQNQAQNWWLYFGDFKTPPRVGFQTVSGDDRLLALPAATFNIGTIIAEPIAFELNESVLNVGDSRHGFVKISKSTEVVERWMFRWGGGTSGFVMVGKPEFVQNSNVISASEKKNTYEYDSGYFTNDLDDVTILKPIYRLIDQDLQWRVRITLKNPFYHQSISKKL